jgi:hypothetical protein
MTRASRAPTLVREAEQHELAIEMLDGPLNVRVRVLGEDPQ